MSLLELDRLPLTSFEDGIPLLKLSLGLRRLLIDVPLQGNGFLFERMASALCPLNGLRAQTRRHPHKEAPKHHQTATKTNGRINELAKSIAPPSVPTSFHQLHDPAPPHPVLLFAPRGPGAAITPEGGPMKVIPSSYSAPTLEKFAPLGLVWIGGLEWCSRVEILAKADCCIYWSNMGACACFSDPKRCPVGFSLQPAKQKKCSPTKRGPPR